MRDTMKCNQCGGQYIIKHDGLELTDAYVGPFAVKVVEYLECEGCGDKAYPPETILEIEKARKLVLEEKLQSFPLRDFVSAAEAASMLGISRQALHKHRRIRRGFIFQTQFSDKAVYLRRSVELFKETGNGRFPLVVPDNKIEYSPKQITSSFFVGYVKTGTGHVPNIAFGGLSQT